MIVMKRILLAAAVLLWASLFASGQRRTVIFEDSPILHLGMFVTDYEDGTSDYFIRLDDNNHYKDSVCIVLSREECPAMYNAILQLERKFREWSYEARANRVSNYSRPMDVEFPPVRFTWRTRVELGYGLAYWDKKWHTARPEHFPTFSFVIDEEGHCSVCINTTFIDVEDPSCTLDSRIIFHSTGILRDFRERCNLRKIDRIYAEKNPAPRSKEFYDSIFK